YVPGNLPIRLDQTTNVFSDLLLARNISKLPYQWYCKALIFPLPRNHLFYLILPYAIVRYQSFQPSNHPHRLLFPREISSYPKANQPFRKKGGISLQPKIYLISLRSKTIL